MTSRHSSDIGFALVVNMEDRCGTSYLDRIRIGQTFAIIKADCLFLPYVFAHQTGHILGAGHELRELNESKYKNSLISLKVCFYHFYGSFSASLAGGRGR
jgi:hypothetical protein